MAEKLAPLGQKTMRWHIALTYFLLWLIAFMNLVNGMVGVFGIQTGPTGDGGVGFALHAYPDMTHPQIFILDGVFALMMCMYTVFVRFQLAAFKRRAPMYLTLLFALNIVESVVYVVLLNVFVPNMVAAYKAKGNDPVMSTVSTAVIAAFTAGLTWVYYQRRKEMFTK